MIHAEVNECHMSNVAMKNYHLLKRYARQLFQKLIVTGDQKQVYFAKFKHPKIVVCFEHSLITATASRVHCFGRNTVFWFFHSSKNGHNNPKTQTCASAILIGHFNTLQYNIRQTQKKLQNNLNILLLPTLQSKNRRGSLYMYIG